MMRSVSVIEIADPDAKNREMRLTEADEKNRAILYQETGVRYRNDALEFSKREGDEPQRQFAPRVEPREVENDTREHRSFDEPKQGTDDNQSSKGRHEAWFRSAVLVRSPGDDHCGKNEAASRRHPRP